ncbi:MAG: hypothetical protein WCG23_06160 [bacterium]
MRVKLMKILKKTSQRNYGQSLQEFLLVSALVAIVMGVALLKLNPSLFVGYFKGSVSGTIDSNGQLLMQQMGD